MYRFHKASSLEEISEIGRIYFQIFSSQEPLDVHSRVAENKETMQPLFTGLLEAFFNRGGAIYFATKEAEEDGRIVGFICGLRFGEQCESEAYRRICLASAAQYELLDRLEQQARSNPQYTSILNGTDTFFIHLVGVKEEHTGHGIAQTLFGLIEDDARKAGFRYCAMEATADGTQAIGIKYGWQTIAEIEYSSFVYEDSRPFADIESPKSAKFLLKDLFVHQNHF